MTETTEGTEPVTEEQHDEPQAQLPEDHPLVRTLAAQKAVIKELKGKAARLAEIEEAQKTEAEKTADRISKAEAEAASVPAKVAEALKNHLVDYHKIDKEDSELFLTATDPELLRKQTARLLEQLDSKRRRRNGAREGENPSATSTSTDDMREFSRQLFGRSD